MGLTLLMSPLFAMIDVHTLLLFLLLYLLHLFLQELRLARKTSSQYSPPTYPFIGCLLSFYKNRHRLLSWYTDLLSESPSQTIVISRIGARRTVVTANPENVEYVLKTNFNNFPKGKPFTEILGDFLGRGIFNVDGDLWHAQRKLASHEFSAKSLRSYLVNALKEELDKKLLPILDSLAKMAPEKNTIDLQELLRRAGFDIVCKVSLGFDPCCLEMDSSFQANSDLIIKAFDTASEICARRGAEPISAVWKVRRMLGIGSERRLKEAIQEINSFITNIIEERKRQIIISANNSNIAGDGEENGMKSSYIGTDLLTKMIVAGNEVEDIRDMMISFVMAGRDTTSAAMTWLFYLLSCNSHIESKLVMELESVEEESLCQYEVVKEMRLLEACICESMRLYPPVAWDSKHPLADDFLPDGTLVRAGDRVTYFPYGMGRMEKLWGKDRLEFKPERWIVDSEEEGVAGVLKKESPYKFPVFQAGPRVCLGKELAFIQMKYIVASILKRFEFKPVCAKPAAFVPLLTAHMAGGLKVHVQKRQ